MIFIALDGWHLVFDLYEYIIFFDCLQCLQRHQNVLRVMRCDLIEAFNLFIQYRGGESFRRMLSFPILGLAKLLSSHIVLITWITLVYFVKFDLFVIVREIASVRIRSSLFLSLFNVLPSLIPVLQILPLSAFLPE